MKVLLTDDVNNQKKKKKKIVRIYKTLFFQIISQKNILFTTNQIQLFKPIIISLIIPHWYPSFPSLSYPSLIKVHQRHYCHSQHRQSKPETHVGVSKTTFHLKSTSVLDELCQLLQCTNFLVSECWRWQRWYDFSVGVFNWSLWPDNSR